MSGPNDPRKISTLLLCLLSSAAMALGQGTNSDVTGTVTDSTGAVIPGVTVTAKNLDKNTERIIVTNDAGVYATGPLVSGDNYQITFKKDGFATVQRGPMTLRTGVVGMNVELTIAQSSQQVVVEAMAPILQTTSSEKSATLGSETLTQIPRTGIPDWQQFIILLPGASGAGNTNAPSMAQVSVNGSMPYSTALFDGARANSPMSNNVITTPIFDAIGEVKVITSLFSAE